MKSIFATILYLSMVNMVAAADAAIWRQELSCDSNSTCRPGAMVVDSKSNEIIILGTSELSHKREANLWLWRIDPNGNVKNRKLLGLLSEYNSFMVGPLGIKATVKPDTGDIVRLKLDDANSMSLSVTNRNMQSSAVKLNIPARKLPGTLMLHDMISCQNDNLLLVGQDGKDGIVTKTDLAGNIVWEKIFDYGQVNILSSVACALDGNDFYVAGLSASLAGKMMFAGPATICVLRYDSNGELKTSDFFEGGLAPWPTSFPKVIYLPSGVVLVVYDKSKNGIGTELYAKAYTKELTPLWEKQILQTKEDGPPAYFDICATREDRFVLAGQVNYWDLRVYECGADGTILQNIELDGEVGAGGVYVDYLAGKIFVAFATKLKENEKEAKIKLLALKPYETN
jgi:hypothetical protein